MIGVCMSRSHHEQAMPQPGISKREANLKPAFLSTFSIEILLRPTGTVIFSPDAASRYFSPSIP